MAVLIIAGVCGSGKTTLGKRVAARLRATFLDADDYHPEANREKMRSGIPLSDKDREPWLDDFGQALAEADPPDGWVVGACSALKEAYRDRLARFVPGLQWAWLEVPREALHERLTTRQHPFMSFSLLDSQLAEWEPLREGWRLPGTLTPDVVADLVVNGLRARRADSARPAGAPASSGGEPRAGVPRPVARP